MDVKIAGVKVGQDRLARRDEGQEGGDRPRHRRTRTSRTGAQDATCRIRPQSLIGEKFIECLPTQPRDPGEQAPPPLQEIKEGDGEGEFLLPATNTSRCGRPRPRQQHHAPALPAALHDHPQRVRRRSRRQRRRAAEGAEEDRPGAQGARRRPRDPREAEQDARRARPTTATRRSRRWRARSEHITGFIRNAGEAAQATAERSADFRADLQKFPAFLRELGPTMQALGRASTTRSCR